jgi:hypothetical protein
MIGLGLTAHQRSIIEISGGLIVAAATFAAALSIAGQKFIYRTTDVFHRAARRKTLVILLLFFFVIAIRLLALPRLGVPIPGIHDEFSYLLMGDTFAHGRLTNPAHPMWISFETFHTNWIPTYCSKYPPAQGTVLAIGELLGNPWIGVLLCEAAMCAAILWMLQGWVPSSWALFGGVLLALKFGIANYWINSYWGGAVAATAGALVLGAVARMRHRARMLDGVLLGLGLAILANSRPYEGFLFSIPIALWVLWWLAGKTHCTAPLRSRLTNVVLPIAAILIVTAVSMGYYNWRLTGNATLFPYVLNSRTYESAGLFVWQHAGPERQYHNEQFEDFYNGFERETFQNSMRDFRRVPLKKIAHYWWTYSWFVWRGAFMLLPGLLCTLGDRRLRLPLAIFAVMATGSLLAVWILPHYSAPLTSVIYLLLIQSMRHLRTVQFSGRALGLAVCVTSVILLPFEVLTVLERHRCDPIHWACEGDPSRAVIENQLKSTPGKHLIVVRYEEDHNIHDEWVFNGAEIDNAKVLWARELSPEQNAKLFAYFKDRQIWLVTPDSDNTYLEPYTFPSTK